MRGSLISQSFSDGVRLGKTPSVTGHEGDLLSEIGKASLLSLVPGATPRDDAMTAEKNNLG